MPNVTLVTPAKPTSFFGPADRRKARNAGSAVYPGPAFGWDSPKSNAGLAGIHRRATLVCWGCRRAELTCLVTEGRGTPSAVFPVIPVVPVFPIAPDPQGSDQFGLVPFCRLFRLFRFIRSHQPQGDGFSDYSGSPATLGGALSHPRPRLTQFHPSNLGGLRKGGGSPQTNYTQRGCVFMFVCVLLSLCCSVRACVR